MAAGRPVTNKSPQNQNQPKPHQALSSDDAADGDDRGNQPASWVRVDEDEDDSGDSESDDAVPDGSTSHGESIGQAHRVGTVVTVPHSSFAPDAGPLQGTVLKIGANGTARVLFRTGARSWIEVCCAMLCVCVWMLLFARQCALELHANYLCEFYIMCQTMKIEQTDVQRADHVATAPDAAVTAGSQTEKSGNEQQLPPSAPVQISEAAAPARLAAVPPHKYERMNVLSTACKLCGQPSKMDCFQRQMNGPIGGIKQRRPADQTTSDQPHRQSRIFDDDLTINAESVATLSPENSEDEGELEDVGPRGQHNQHDDYSALIAGVDGWSETESPIHTTTEGGLALPLEALRPGQTRGSIRCVTGVAAKGVQGTAGYIAIRPHKYARKNLFSSACKYCGLPTKQACIRRQIIRAVGTTTGSGKSSSSVGRRPNMPSPEDQRQATLKLLQHDDLLPENPPDVNGPRSDNGTDTSVDHAETAATGTLPSSNNTRSQPAASDKVASVSPVPSRTQPDSTLGGVQHSTQSSQAAARVGKLPVPAPRPGPVQTPQSSEVGPSTQASTSATVAVPVSAVIRAQRHVTVRQPRTLRRQDVDRSTGGADHASIFDDDLTINAESVATLSPENSDDDGDEVERETNRQPTSPLRSNSNSHVQGLQSKNVAPGKMPKPVLTRSRQGHYFHTTTQEESNQGLPLDALRPGQIRGSIRCVTGVAATGMGGTAGSIAIRPHKYVRKSLFSSACKYCGKPSKTACLHQQIIRAIGTSSDARHPVELP